MIENIFQLFALGQMVGRALSLYVVYHRELLLQAFDNKKVLENIIPH